MRMDRLIRRCVMCWICTRRPEGERSVEVDGLDVLHRESRVFLANQDGQVTDAFDDLHRRRGPGDFDSFDFAALPRPMLTTGIRRSR